VEVSVREHALFERDGEHLSCEVPVSFATAALGGSVAVPTLEGDVNLKIPAETQSGRVFRLRDKGVKPVRGGARGDLFCRVVIETPVHLSAEQRELIRKLEDTLRAHPGKHAPREKGFLDGVRRFFSGADEDSKPTR
jgi:molecular chaperone DnaJ